MNTPFNIDLSQPNISPYLHARKTNRVRFDFDCVNEYIFNGYSDFMVEKGL